MKKLKNIANFAIFEANKIDIFNARFSNMLDTLSQQGIDAKALNNIKARLYGNRQVIKQMDLEQQIAGVQNIQELLGIINQMAEFQKGQRGVQPEQDPNNLKNLFPTKYFPLFDTIEKELTPETAKDIGSKIANFRLAIEAQKREEELLSAKTKEEAEDILQRVELVSRANNWADLAPSRIRSELKQRLEEFADILSGYDDFHDFRDNFMNKANRFYTVDKFFEGVKNHIAGISDDYDKIVDKINNTEGAEIEKLLEEQILAWIYTHPASNKLGEGTQWCISYDTPSYFNSYVFNDFRKQYFIWDFSKSPADVNSRIGVTLHEDGSIRNAHNKPDRECSSYVREQPWFQHLEPLSKEQTGKWLKYLTDNNIKLPNIKVGILAAIEMDDYDLFRNLLRDNADQIRSERKFASKMLSNLIENGQLEFVKQVGEMSKGLLTADSGAPLIQAYRLGNKEIFDYIKSNISKKTIELAKKFNKNKKFANVVDDFMSVYNKEL